MKTRTFFIFKIPKLDQKKLIKYLKEKYGEVTEEKDVITTYKNQGLIFKYFPLINLVAISPKSQYIEVIDFLNDLSKNLDLNLYKFEISTISDKKFKEIYEKTDVSRIVLDWFSEEKDIEEEELEEEKPEIEAMIAKGTIKSIQTRIKIDSVTIHTYIDNGGRIDLADENIVYLPKVVSFIEECC